MSTAHEEFSRKPTLAPAKTPPPPSAPPVASSRSAASEEIKTTTPRAPVADAERKAAEGRLTPLQKEYDGLLEQIKTTADPVARAGLVLRKGNVVREMDTIKRSARLP